MWDLRPFVVGIIAFLQIGPQLLVFLPYKLRHLDRNAIEDQQPQFGPGFFLWTLVFNAGCIMIYWTYWLACMTPPGFVPHGWVPAQSEGMIEEAGVLFQSNEEKQGRYCQKCRCFKPPRSHHCSVCRRCILKLDHHCPWINTCVGFQNQGNFGRFLLYVDFTCFMLMWSLFRHLYVILLDIDSEWRQFGHSVTEVPVIEIILIVAALFIDAIVLISVGVLSIYQVSYICTNSTTIEGWEQERVRSYARRQNLPRVRYPFDIGFSKNVKSVLGENPLFWLWPQKMVGTGTEFEMRPGLTAEEYHWPPAWYQQLKGHSISESDSDDDDYPLEYPPAANTRIRRGSEGYEVRSLTVHEREELVLTEIHKNS